MAVWCTILRSSAKSKNASIQAFKHSSIQAFKHSSIQAFKHSNTAPDSLTIDPARPELHVRGVQASLLRSLEPL